MTDRHWHIALALIALWAAVSIGPYFWRLWG